MDNGSRSAATTGHYIVYGNCYLTVRGDRCKAKARKGIGHGSNITDKNLVYLLN